jgi:hypothetical protein
MKNIWYYITRIPHHLICRGLMLLGMQGKKMTAVIFYNHIEYFMIEAMSSKKNERGHFCI